MHSLIDNFRTSLESLDRVGAKQTFVQALQMMSPIEAVEQIVVPSLEQIGEAWTEGKIALSQIYMGSRFCEELVGEVLPASDPDRKSQPHSAIVVLNDYHMLGKQIVYSVMRASGFELFDYGRMDVDQLVERALTDRIRVLLISVLLLPSALKVKEVSERLKASGEDITIIVGGAPFLFDDNLWKDVGADAMGRNATEAVSLTQEIMNRIGKS
jgi:methanogenic corrinoid protein MtbC1